MSADLARVMDVAIAAVDAGAAAALTRAAAGLAVEKKPDGSPVTAADREAEAAIVSVIRAAFPGAAILGEESGEHAGDPGSRWIVDPIDGTRGFSRGGVHWGPLVAYEEGGTVVAGATALPALKKRFWAARGLGAWRSVAGAPSEKIRLSSISQLAEATVSFGELKDLISRPGARGLVYEVAQARCYGDLAGCVMLLEGLADVWIEAGVKSWDLAALSVIVEEAGGRFTNFAGGRSVEAGNAVASNGILHDAVLKAIR